MLKTGHRDAEQAATVTRVARITGYKPNYIYKVIRGDRQNELVLACAMEVIENDGELIKRLKKQYGPKLKKTIQPTAHA